MPNIFLKRDHEPTCVTSNTSSVLDHILTNAGWKISQKVIDVGIPDHQLIYCTWKLFRTKGNMHNQIGVLPLKNQTPELLKEELMINFPDYNIFSNVNIVYLDLVEKTLSVNLHLSKILESKTTPKIRWLQLDSNP